MGIAHRSHRNDINWLTDGPLAPYVDVFKQQLVTRGYATHTVARYLAGVAHFAQWARRRRLRLHCMDAASIAEFLDHHLPECQCHGRVCRIRRDLSAALSHLLVVLRAQCIVAAPTASATPSRQVKPESAELTVRTVLVLLV